MVAVKTNHYLTLALGIQMVFSSGAGTSVAQAFHFQAKVVDTNGQPLPGAIVERHEDPDWLTGSASPRLAERAIANDQGIVTFTITNQTPFTSVASKPGLSIAWFRWYPQVSLERSPVELTLTPPAAVGGIVQDAGGKPVADAEVWVMTAYRKGTPDASTRWSPLNHVLGRRFFATRTTAEGKFRLEGMPLDATLDLAVKQAGLALKLQPQTFADGGPSLAYQAGQRDIVLTLKPAGVIEGRVVEEDSGAPVADARIKPIGMGTGNNLPATAPTGPDGRFRIADLGAGEYNLRATIGANPFPEWLCDTIPVSVEFGATNRDVKITASHGGVLEVTVRDRCGQPIKGAPVTAGGTARTTDQGVARFRLAPGEYNVLAPVPGFRIQHTLATCARGQTNQVALALEPEPRLAGIVLDPQGKPAPKVTVSLLPFGHREQSTDTEGRFTLTSDSDQPGDRVVVARDPARQLAAALELEAEATNAELRLEPAWTLAGRIVDTNGVAIPGAQAQAMFEIEGRSCLFGSPAPADAGGRFEIQALPFARSFNIQISAPGFGQDTLTVAPPEGDAGRLMIDPVAPEGNGPRVELDPIGLLAADQRIAGVVIDADDKPVSWGLVSSYGNRQPNLSARTDSRGQFEFKQVCVGPIRLSASSQRGEVGAAIVEGGDTNIMVRVVEAGGRRARAALPASLEGKPLPDLTPLGLTAEDIPANQRVLAVLIDAEQRPSRRVLKRLTELADMLKEKGVAVVVLQAGALDGEGFAAWKQEAALPFPVGLLKGNRDKTRAAWGAAALPWLILTDAHRKVTDEGFAPGELDEKLNPTDK